MALLLLTLLTCPQPKVVNLSNEAFNDHDRKTLQIVARRCIMKYKNSPCLKYFIKKEKRNYRAICGE